MTLPTDIRFTILHAALPNENPGPDEIVAACLKEKDAARVAVETALGAKEVRENIGVLPSTFEPSFGSKETVRLRTRLPTLRARSQPAS